VKRSLTGTFVLEQPRFKKTWTKICQENDANNQDWSTFQEFQQVLHDANKIWVRAEAFRTENPGL